MAHTVICLNDNTASTTGAISAVLDGRALASRWNPGQETPDCKERLPGSPADETRLGRSRSWEIEKADVGFTLLVSERYLG